MEKIPIIESEIESLPSESESNSEVQAETEEEYLLKQFDNPEKINLGGEGEDRENIEIVDISPRELKTEVPTIMLPGFTVTPAALKDAILRTAQAGRRVISAYAPHGIDIKEKRTDLPEAELRKLELLLKIIEAKKLDKVNVIANSESAIYATAAAVLYPEKFADIVYMEPAGLIGDDSFLKLILRTQSDDKMFKKHKDSLQPLKYPSSPEIGKKSIRSDILASIKEVIAISKADITPGLEEIHKQGVGVSIIHAADDRIFPMEKVQKMVKGKMIDGFYSVRGSHNMVYLYEPFGRIAEKALSDLEKKREKLEQEGEEE